MAQESYSFQLMIQGRNIKKGTVVRRLDCAIEQVNRYPLNKDHLNLVFTKSVDSNFHAF